MKVICIYGVKSGTVGALGIRVASKIDEIKEGETYTVCEIKTVHGKEGYRLQERSIKNYYQSYRFMPLSTIDETELIKEREPALA